MPDWRSSLKGHLLQTNHWLQLRLAIIRPHNVRLLLTRPQMLFVVKTLAGDTSRIRSVGAHLQVATSPQSGLAVQVRLQLALRQVALIHSFWGERLHHVCWSRMTHV